MSHPELFAVPALMLLDYALTILGAETSAPVYRQHFKTPCYELNPLWRKSVARLRWLNPRHLALVALSTGLLLLFDSAVPLPPDTFDLLLGMLFGALGTVCGRHLTNLLLFHYLNRHPNEISGEVEMSLALVLKISLFTHVGLIPLFAILVILIPNHYVVGVFLGLLVLVFAHVLWGLRAKSAEVSAGEEKVEEHADTEG